MPNSESLKLLFVINPVSGGKEKINWEECIEKYFRNTQQPLKIYTLDEKDARTALNKQISEFKPDKVIAVGGDGTVKLVAEKLIGTEMLLGILPAGSANGMAKELEIPDDVNKALDVICNGAVKKIDLIRINEKDICIHLSDIGLNALLIKYFEEGKQRGMWGYIKVAFRVLRTKRLMRIELKLNNQSLSRVAYMIVIANAKTYGTGAVINPEGSLEDGKFEVIIIRKLSLLELFRMLISHKPFNSECIEVLQTTQVALTTHKKNHFQIDGEYLGKTDSILAEVMPGALRVISPS